MPPLWRAIRALILTRPARGAQTQTQIRHIADARPFQPGDHVLLRPKTDRSATPLLSRPLQPGRRIDTHKGSIPHDDIIGKRVRDVLRTAPTKAGKPGVEFRLHGVKLEEYVRLTPRLVTPLYPQDAQVIVGLLDLHPEPPRWGQGCEGEPKLEILEAGTGHGALTLFLSRAIHAANPPYPHHTTASTTDEEDTESIAIEAYKSARRALIHTIDISPRYSAHARTIVRNFRHGLYAPNIDFHVGNVSSWTTTTLAARNNTPFLSHAFLDLPGAETHISSVSKALRTDGCLVMFNPSITQIIAAVEEVRGKRLPLELERVVELGVNGGSGGREWDVRAVKPRRKADFAKTAEEAVDSDAAAAEDSGVEVSRDGEVDRAVTPAVAPAEEEKDEWKMVCRPKVGDAIVGGGFLGVFRKMRIHTPKE